MSILRFAASVLSNPLLMGFIVAACGLLLFRIRRRRAGASIMAAGALLAYLASTSLVGNALLGYLESKYSPPDTIPDEVRDIVVLGSGYDPRDHVPVSAALGADGLMRITEGVRLTLSRPGSRLLVSGGAAPGSIPSALGYAKFAEELGIQPSSILVMDKARTTEEEARDISAKLGHSRFILVTSAYHMPRAMRLMHRAGADPIAAPAGQLSHEKRGAERIGLTPGSRGLRMTEAALHEYLGLASVAFEPPPPLQPSPK